VTAGYSGVSFFQGSFRLLLFSLWAPFAFAQTGDRPTCRIDRIDGPVATGGFAELTGFAVDPGFGTPVRKVEISLDEKTSGETSLAGLRPDVSTHFARPDYLWSGWSGSISLEGASPGRHLVVVTVTGGSGLKSVCARGVIDVLAVPKSPRTPAWRVAAGILLRTVAFLFWLALVGWVPALFLGSRPILLAAPLLGLALLPGGRCHPPGLAR
jgi:hypothetical protein